MSIQLFERPGSGRMTVVPPTKVLEFGSEGEVDYDTVMAYAIGVTPAFVVTPMGFLYRQDVALSPQGHDVYHITVPYAQNKRESGNWRFSFSTVGGTTHIENSGPFGGTINSYKRTGATEDIPDRKGTIGFVSADRIDGCDKITPVFRFTIHFRHPMGVITLTQMKTISRVTGMVNSTTFLSFAAGEVLFLGADGSEGTDCETEVAYHFEASENVTDLTIGDIENIEKDGHDYLWISHTPDVDADKGVRVPEFVYVERVYTRANLALKLGIS